jgi:HK97 family phage major capsid protein
MNKLTRAVNRGIQSVRAEDDSIAGMMRQLNAAFEGFKADHNNEVRTLRREIDTLATQAAAHQMGGATIGAGHTSLRSIGAQATKGLDENSAFMALREWNAGTCRLNVAEAPIRAALTNEDGAPTGSTTFIPNQPEFGGIKGPVLRPLRLLDVLPSRPTRRDSVEFVQLNATGDASEQIHEGDEKAEVQFSGAMKKANIVTIAGHTTASRQVLEDFGGLGNQVDRVLRHKVVSRLENQLINGPGGDGRILGLLSQSTEFTPTIGTTPADIIGESLVRMADAGYLPGLILMNPIDWFRIQITKSVQEEDYIFGSPTVPVPPALWNTPIVTTPSVAEGTAMTIDTQFTSVLDRQQVSVLLSNSHKDYFTRNLVLILAEMRAGLEVLDLLAVQRMALTPGP